MNKYCYAIFFLHVYTCRSPAAYKNLTHGGVFVFPCQETLRLHKNVVKQNPGIVENNMKWMLHEANEKRIDQKGRCGGLLLDEMTIQHDLQIVKKGDEWDILGAIDLGDLVNSLEDVMNHHKEVKMATHILQFMFLGYGGFRWPCAYFTTSNASAHQLYFTFFQLVGKLFEYEFEVDYCMLDGSTMNRNFTSLLFPDNPRKFNFIARSAFSMSKGIPIIQDIKHCIKKLRNGLLSSAAGEKAKRTLILDGKQILWSQFQEAYEHSLRHGL